MTNTDIPGFSLPLSLEGRAVERVFGEVLSIRALLDDASLCTFIIAEPCDVSDDVSVSGPIFRRLVSLIEAAEARATSLASWVAQADSLEPPAS